MTLLYRVVEAVHMATGVHRELLVGSTTTQYVRSARSMAFYLLREKGWSLQEIAEAFNRQDHTTAAMAIQRFSAALVRDPALHEQYLLASTRLNADIDAINEVDIRVRAWKDKLPPMVRDSISERDIQALVDDLSSLVNP